MLVRDWGVVMNKLIIGSVALVASLAGSAMAADMPVRAPVVVESWTGFYVGVALGGRFSDSTWTTNCLSAGAPGGVGCPLNFAANGPRFVTDNPQTKHGAHDYTAEQFGLDADGLRRRFAPYIERFGVQIGRGA